MNAILVHSLITLASAAMSAPSAAGSAGTPTVWVAGEAGWHEATSWDSGVPTSGRDADIAGGGSAQVTTPSNVCLGLRVGLDGTNGQVIVNNSAVLATGQDVSVGHSGAASLVVNDGTLSVGGDLIVNMGTVGAGGNVSSNIVVTGTISVAGTFYVVGRGAAVQCAAFEITTPLAGLTTVVRSNGAQPIVVSGPITLNGDLTVAEAVGDAAPVGTPIVLMRGDSITGDFDEVTLPGVDWTLTIDGTTVNVTHEKPNPTEPANWSDIKRTFDSIY